MIKKVVCGAAVLVLGLTLATKVMRSPELESFLLPGDIAGMLITGFHGDDPPVGVSFAVNTLFYSLLGIAIFGGLRRVKKWELARNAKTGK